MDAHRHDTDVDWAPGWEWLAAVCVIHLLAVVPWMAHLGLWPLIPGALSLLGHGRVWLRGEVWRFALMDERVVVLEPKRPGLPRRTARLCGPPWMTERWLVVRTSRRVLIVGAGRYEPARFAMLRRAFLGMESG